MAKVMSHNNKVLTDGESVFLSGEYELQPATTETLGGVIVGDGLEVEEDGTLNVTGGGGGEPVPCKFTIKVVDIAKPSQKYDVPGFNSGTGFIGQAVTFNIPAINRALGNNDNHQSGDTWYTVFGLSSDPLETITDIVQVMLEEDNQVIEFSGAYRRKA